MILAFDTSNYTTSIAVYDMDKGIVCDERMILKVAKGNRGLRQSDALFQHIENLERMSIKLDCYDIDAVCVSSRPRPLEGSYMPCFRAGITSGRLIASLIGVPYFEVSHQEGHIAAAKYKTAFEDEETLICCHLSGGTCEILKYDNGDISIEGGSLDISFGQLIDRTGVFYGIDFPAGKHLDRLALAGNDARIFRKVNVKDGYFNISGIENQVMSLSLSPEDAASAVFRTITDVLSESVAQVCDRTGIDKVLFAGGVSSSRFIRERLSLEGVHYQFGKPELACDNAVGTAILGGKLLWQQSL